MNGYEVLKFKCNIYLGIFKGEKYVKVQTMDKNGRVSTIPISVRESVAYDANGNVLDDTSHLRPMKDWWVRVLFSKNICEEF